MRRITHRIALALLVALAGCTPAAAPPREPAAPARERVKDFPDFTLDTLQGESVSLSDFVGDGVVMLVFWGSWCQTCVAAMGQLNEIYRRQRDAGVRLLGISMDGPETIADVRGYVQRNRIEFPILLDQESRAVSLYNPKRVAPFFVTIDEVGRVVNRRDGYQPGDEVAIEAEFVRAGVK